MQTVSVANIHGCEKLFLGFSANAPRSYPAPWQQCTTIDNGSEKIEFANINITNMYKELHKEM